MCVTQVRFRELSLSGCGEVTSTNSLATLPPSLAQLVELNCTFCVHVARSSRVLIPTLPVNRDLGDYFRIAESASYSASARFENAECGHRWRHVIIPATPLATMKSFHCHNSDWSTISPARTSLSRLALRREFPQNRDTKRYPPVQPILLASSCAIWCQAARESKQRQRKRLRKEKVLPNIARFAA